MLNKALKDFKDFPKNFLEWITEFTCSIPPDYTIQEAKEIYRDNCHKELGFIYRKYTPKSASMDNAYYDDTNFISQMNIEITTIGKPLTFFGTVSEYKNLLNNLSSGLGNTKINYYYLKEFHQFGKIYIFESGEIKNPMDVF